MARPYSDTSLCINKYILHWVQKDPAVYELKWSFVQEHGFYINTATPLTTLGPNTISETFQMRYYIKVSFKGYQKYEMVKFETS